MAVKKTMQEDGKKAVLVMAYGGPDSLDDIEPYLLDIRGGRPTSPELIEEIRHRYALIGGRSPLLEITQAQASRLELCLNNLAPAAFRVFVGMRHWKPYIRETVHHIAAQGYHSVTALCMAPHASKMSTGAYLQKLRDAQETLSDQLAIDFIDGWYDQPFLIQSFARKIQAAVGRIPPKTAGRIPPETVGQYPPEMQANIHYLFTAHSLPAVLKEQGDPYDDQVLTTARLLAEALDLTPEQWSFCYQSAGAASVRWLGPSIEEALPTLADAGKKTVLVTPVGFLADHVEVLYDLDIEAQEIASNHGIRLVRSESLNTSPDFIEGLAKFIVERSKLPGNES